MKKSEFDITVHYEIEGELWYEGIASKDGKRFYTHDQATDPDIVAVQTIKSLKNILIDIIKHETGDFQPHTVKIMWLLIDVQYRHTAGNQIMRTKVYSFAPDPARYPGYFVE